VRRSLDQSQARDTTQDLLVRWNEGDPVALDALLGRHLPWLRERVEKTLGTVLRTRLEVEDVVQDSVVELLRYAPKFVSRGEEAFRGLLARIVRNVVADRDDFFRARRRGREREQRLASGSQIGSDPPRRTVSTPSVHAQRGEEAGWVQLALGLLDPQSRRILVLREWDRVPFEEIAAELSIGETAARMRHHRALLRLSSAVVQLKAGDLAAALAASA
jgi:RNA polymerase sigma factor (sigma-70 family)